MDSAIVGFCSARTGARYRLRYHSAGSPAPRRAGMEVVALRRDHELFHQEYGCAADDRPLRRGRARVDWNARGPLGHRRASHRFPQHPMGFPDLWPALIRRDGCRLRDRLCGRRNSDSQTSGRKRAAPPSGFARMIGVFAPVIPLSTSPSRRLPPPLQPGRPNRVRVGTPIAGSGARGIESARQHPSRSRAQSGLPGLDRMHRPVC